MLAMRDKGQQFREQLIAGLRSLLSDGSLALGKRQTVCHGS
jgi:hypothetical protein